MTLCTLLRQRYTAIVYNTWYLSVAGTLSGHATYTPKASLRAERTLPNLPPLIKQTYQLFFKFLPVHDHLEALRAEKRRHYSQLWPLSASISELQYAMHPIRIIEYESRDNTDAKLCA